MAPTSSPPEAIAGAAAALVAEVEALRRREPEQAREALERGFAAATRGASDARRGELWRLRGHVLRSLRRARAAADCYTRAARWYARAGEVREQGRCAIGLVDSLMYLGRYDDAAHAARRGRRLLERAGDRVSLARLLNNEGNLFHRLDLPERALVCYREARRLLARAGDARGANLIHVNVANCLSLLGRLAEARRLYQDASRGQAAAGFELDALTAEYNLAYLDFLEHRYEASLAGLGRVRDEARGRGYPSLAALAALDRAEIFLRMGAHDDALGQAREAIAACEQIGLGYERAKAETFAALAEFRLGAAAAARERLERTLGAFHREGNAVWTGEALVGLATVWWHEGNPRAAAALLGAACRRFARAGDREREACALALRVRALGAFGARAAASATLARIDPAARRGRASARLRHLVLAAEAAELLARGDMRRARTKLERAARESERLAARILDEHWRASFWGEWGWPHRELAVLELEQGRVAEALEALEAGRGRALVGPTHRSRRTGVDALPRRVREWAGGHLARERERTARSADRMLEVWETQPGRTPPPPPALGRALSASAPHTIRAARLRRTLPAGTRLVDYLVHDGQLDAIVLDRDAIRGHRGLVTTRKLNELAQALLFSLRGAAFVPAPGTGAGPGLREELEELAALLLWPALGRGTPRRLAVVPVGPIARIPWAALPLPDGRAVCEAMETVVVPGLRLGLARQGVRSAAPGAPLIVAVDPGELHHVAPETNAVLRCFPAARVLAGADATAERFLREAPGAAWIHFAGHGHFHADAPHDSGLRFADRWLPASELAELELSARWITLSACQTARALVRPGEEWFGISRTLLLCGAGAVVASQWDIEDEAAARLMGTLYGRLASGAPLAAGLAGAQAEQYRAGSHPLDWAGFVLLGGPGLDARPDFAISPNGASHDDPPSISSSSSTDIRKD